MLLFNLCCITANMGENKEMKDNFHIMKQEETVTESWDISFKYAFIQGCMKKNQHAFIRIDRNGTEVWDTLSNNLYYLGPPLYYYAAFSVQVILTWDTLIDFKWSPHLQSLSD